MTYNPRRPPVFDGQVGAVLATGDGLVGFGRVGISAMLAMGPGFVVLVGRVGVCVPVSVGTGEAIATTDGVATATTGFVTGTVQATRSCAKATQKKICMIRFKSRTLSD